MKAQLNDIKASLLYLIIFQLIESGQDQITPYYFKGVQDKLKELGYPDQDIAYDEDGIPQVQWQNPNFECQKVYEAIEYNPAFFLLNL